MSWGKLRIRVVKKLIDINEKLIFERRLKKHYKKSGKIATVIDVGANRGQTIDFFLSINPECRIYAIEPNPTLFDRLNKKYADHSNVSIFRFGVSETTGTREFFENIFDYSSTFEQINMDSAYQNKKAKVLGVDAKHMVTKSYPVEVIKLSDFIVANKLESGVDVLKIDTEGHEYYCLLGLFSGTGDFPVRFIQLEHHNNELYSNQVDFSKIDELLVSNKFRLDVKIRHGFGNFDEVIYRRSKDGPGA